LAQPESRAIHTPEEAKALEWKLLRRLDAYASASAASALTYGSQTHSSLYSLTHSSLLTYTFLSLLTDTFGRPELKKNQYSRGAVNDGTHSPLSFALAGPERARHALNGHRGQHQRQSASTLGSSRFFDLVAQGTLMHTLSHMHSTHLLALMHNIRRCENLSNRLEYHCSGKCPFY